jgi:hypothetical protein
MYKKNIYINTVNSKNNTAHVRGLCHLTLISTGGEPKEPFAFERK